MTTSFTPFPKIPRLSRDCVITEKIHGTNASILVETDLTERPDGVSFVDYQNGLFTSVRAGSRTRWITPDNDNHGFAKWVEANKAELAKLGPGHHFGEWWGQGIQHGYGLKEKRFSLFNTNRWTDAYNARLAGHENNFPPCCHVVPVLYDGPFSSNVVESVLDRLRETGSIAAPGWMDPEGVVIFHTAASCMFKKTIKGDEKPKGLA